MKKISLMSFLLPLTYTHTDYFDIFCPFCWTAAVVNDYGVTSACLEATLEKLNKKQDTFTEAINKESEKLKVGRDEHKIEHMIGITNIYRSKLDKIKDEMGNFPPIFMDKQYW